MLRCDFIKTIGGASGIKPVLIGIGRLGESLERLETYVDVRRKANSELSDWILLPLLTFAIAFGKYVLAVIVIFINPGGLEQTPGVMRAHAFFASTLAISVLFGVETAHVPAAEHLQSLPKHLITGIVEVVFILVVLLLLSAGAFISSIILRLPVSFNRSMQTVGYFLASAALICLVFYFLDPIFLFFAGTRAFKPIALAHDLALLGAYCYCLFFLPANIYCRSATFIRRVGFAVCLYLGFTAVAIVVSYPILYFLRDRIENSFIAGTEINFAPTASLYTGVVMDTLDFVFRLNRLTDDSNLGAHDGAQK
jgi:hypothetical protein